MQQRFSAALSAPLPRAAAEELEVVVAQQLLHRALAIKVTNRQLARLHEDFEAEVRPCARACVGVSGGWAD